MCLYILFSLHDPATTEIYTLSLHDALPIFAQSGGRVGRAHARQALVLQRADVPSHHPQAFRAHRRARQIQRSEEHTSELQSQSNLVCRLLLEKKKYIATLYIQTDRIDDEST